MLVTLVEGPNGKWRATRGDPLKDKSAAVLADTAEEAVEGLLRFVGWKCSDAADGRRG